MKKTFYLISKNSYITLIITFLVISCKDKNENTITLDGKIEREQISVVSKLAGKVQNVLAEEGQDVEAGDTLIILELQEVEAKKYQAKGALLSAEAQYQMAKKGATQGQIIQLNAKVSGLKEQLSFAEKSMRRMQNMLSDSLVPQQKFDEVFAKYQGAKNQYTASVAERDEAQNGARIEQQTMALGQQERALGGIDEINIAANERFIKAPQKMSIENITLKKGELALPGYSIVNGFLNETTFFKFTIAESQLSSVKKGGQIQVHIPYENKTITGKVVWIKPLSSYANITSAYPDFEQGQTLYEIKIAPINPKETENLLIKSTVQISIQSVNKK
ncbi:HlyD family secretion protein [Flavobacterium psychrophilum]|uniref:HlyD family secretion protein n=1 Tax=Flavobacterium psychrophilum TaxID=96345 RepID=UPI002BDF1A8B|nr:biotin/lipoyl-binding protein [Flavobacterium psychrophilum]MEB3390163.1 biotin/lipoyl-binding protein [Flavobacterium psychrophilum]MEB3404594.1 biotin/lipoyl-binding protein [Flavobacterium psychrophilum]